MTTSEIELVDRFEYHTADTGRPLFVMTIHISALGLGQRCGEPAAARLLIVDETQWTASVAASRNAMRAWCVIQRVRLYNRG